VLTVAIRFSSGVCSWGTDCTIWAILPNSVAIPVEVATAFSERYSCVKPSAALAMTIAKMIIVL